MRPATSHDVSLLVQALNQGPNVFEGAAGLDVIISQSS